MFQGKFESHVTEEAIFCNRRISEDVRKKSTRVWNEKNATKFD